MTSPFLAPLHRTVDGHRPEPAQIVRTAARFVDAADLPLTGVDGVVRALVEASISVQAPL